MAQNQAEGVMQSRIANFREIGAANKDIADELKSGHPDLRKIRESAVLIQNRGAEMLHWFPPGSEAPFERDKSWLDTIVGWFSSDSLGLPGEVKSHAKSAIWTEKAAFERAHNRFKAQADQMVQAAQSGNTTAISAQFRKLGETCKGCHDHYREKID